MGLVPSPDNNKIPRYVREIAGNWLQVQASVGLIFLFLGRRRLMRSRLGRRLGLARLRLRPWLRLLLRWSGGRVVFWCRGTRRLVGLAGLRFGFNVLRRRSVLFRRMRRQSVVRLRRRPVIRGFVGLWDVVRGLRRLLRRLVHMRRRSSMCGGRIVGPGSILGWLLLLLIVLPRMRDTVLLIRLLVVLRGTRDVLLPTGRRFSLRRGLGIVSCVRRLPVFDRQAGPLCIRGA